MSDLKHPELNNLLEMVRGTRRDVESLWEEFDEEQLRWKPGPDRWGVSDCIEHLVISSNLYDGKIEDAVRRGAARRNTQPNAPIKISLIGKVFLKMVDPDYEGKNKAPKLFQPSRSEAPPEIAQQFLKCLDGMESFVRRADGLDLNKIKLASPATGLIRFRLGECLMVQIKHQQRHLKQARRVTETAEFPKKAS